MGKTISWQNMAKQFQHLKKFSKLFPTTVCANSWATDAVTRKYQLKDNIFQLGRRRIVSAIVDFEIVVTVHRYTNGETSRMINRNKPVGYVY